ncbi:MAG TPA: radical SAM protein [Candidatus Hydrogenedentes bacterium]|nr:radical SAM protein [Candidatus Hydrogenedentota bacterium]
MDARFTLEPFVPAYRRLNPQELSTRVESAVSGLQECRSCPRACGVNRMKNEKGMCKTGRFARVASIFPHFGEEECLRGWRGSGTIFFSGCNLACAFCQNWDISQNISGAEYSPSLLAEAMLELQGMGCHNINFVTPEHVAPQVIEAVAEAIPRGLNLPIVYNTSAYDSLDTLRLLDGLVDIYMPDFKYWESETAGTYSNAKDYPERAREAIREMHRQAGVLRFSTEGLARRGVLIRHLVMPGQLDESAAIFEWLAQELSPDTFVNLMGQYHPAYRVGQDPRYESINRRPYPQELAEARKRARQAGLWRFDKE